MSVLDKMLTALHLKKKIADPIQLMPTIEAIPMEKVQELAIAAQANNILCYVENESTYINFSVQVEIPVGFKIRNDGRDFKIRLDIDQHTLETIGIKSIRRTIVPIDEYNREIECNIPVIQLKLKGDIYYNCEVGGFEAVDKLEGLDNVSFTGFNFVPIDVELGYCCEECQEDNPLRDYSITVATYNPFVIAPDGEKIIYDSKTRNNRFFEVLENGLNTRYMIGSYTLIITPSPDPVS